MLVTGAIPQSTQNQKHKLEEKEKKKNYTWVS